VGHELNRVHDVIQHPSSEMDKHPITRHRFNLARINGFTLSSGKKAGVDAGTFHKFPPQRWLCDEIVRDHVADARTIA